MASRMLRAAFLKAIPLALVIAAIVAAQPTQSRPAFLAVAASNCDRPTTPFCDALMTPLPGWTGHVFHLSQSYPKIAPRDVQPWLKYDPLKQSDAYLRAALAYFYQGNIRQSVEASFDPALNPIRAWYNAPWQDFGLNGREFIHGLTRERVSLPGELAAQQTRMWNNYAVGFYNAPGGVTIGKVWMNHGKPTLDLAHLPEGTVAAKLLFTTAPVSQVPYLAGSPTWSGYVYANPNDPSPTATSPRAVLPLRLLQIDIAVKDARVGSLTGWVFGTFVYGGGPGSHPAGSGWTNVSPVGVMWGNDPGYSGSGPLKQTALNPRVHMPHVGYQGRLNGPVDNPMSSCLSCHSTAQIVSGPMIPPKGVDPSPWFQNIPSGTPFTPGQTSMDYSLQMEVGISNFMKAAQLAHAPTAKARTLLLRKLQAQEERPPRDGG